MDRREPVRGGGARGRLGGTAGARAGPRTAQRRTGTAVPALGRAKPHPARVGAAAAGDRSGDHCRGRDLDRGAARDRPHGRRSNADGRRPVPRRRRPAGPAAAFGRTARRRVARGAAARRRRGRRGAGARNRAGAGFRSAAIRRLRRAGARAAGQRRVRHGRAAAQPGSAVGEPRPAGTDVRPTRPLLGGTGPAGDRVADPRLPRPACRAGGSPVEACASRTAPVRSPPPSATP